MKETSTARKAARWLPVIVCLALIAFFSSQDAFSQDLRRPIGKCRVLVKGVQALPRVSLRYSRRVIDNKKDPVQFIHFFVRKGAHAIIYAALGLSFSYAVEPSIPGAGRRWLASAAFVTLVGGLDELNQTLVPGRSGLALDVCIDLAGFVAASLLLAVLRATRSGSHGQGPGAKG